MRLGEEALKRGFEKIKEGCALYDGPLPEYDINESGIMVLCKACDRYLELLAQNENLNFVICDERIKERTNC